MEKQILYYRTLSGNEPYFDWFNSIRDQVTRYRVMARLKRIKQGNYGDHKRFHGIIEIRINFGKGYRLYCIEDGSTIVVLLVGGDKASQWNDIKEALEYGRDYYEQKEI